MVPGVPGLTICADGNDQDIEPGSCNHDTADDFHAVVNNNPFDSPYCNRMGAETAYNGGLRTQTPPIETKHRVLRSSGKGGKQLFLIHSPTVDPIDLDENWWTGNLKALGVAAAIWRTNVEYSIDDTGGLVDVFRDLSGNCGNLLASGGDRPNTGRTIGSLDAFDLDGTEYMQMSDTVVLTQPYMFRLRFIADSHPTSGNHLIIFDTGDSGGATRS